jgi:hypothetical protein
MSPAAPSLLARERERERERESEYIRLVRFIARMLFYVMGLLLQIYVWATRRGRLPHLLDKQVRSAAVWTDVQDFGENLGWHFL